MITHEECKMQVWMPPKQRHQVPRFSWWRLSPHCFFRLTQTQMNVTFFLLYGSPFLFMILAVSYRKKNWLLKNYYSCKLIWPYRSIGQETSDDPDVKSKPLGLLIALSLFFFSVKQKQNSRNVTESEYKKCTSVYASQTHRDCSSSTCSPWQCK